jgi:hypothetical protein
LCVCLKHKGYTTFSHMSQGFRGRDVRVEALEILQRHILVFSVIIYTTYCLDDEVDY